MHRWLLCLFILLGVSGLSPVQAAILYVDKDFGCPGNGTTGTPYCSLQNAFNVVNPGDSIRIRDSATPYDQNAVLTRSGTLANRITIEPDNGHNPIIRYTGSGSATGAFVLNVASYITIQNLTFDGAGVYTSAYAVRINGGATNNQGNEVLGNTFKNWGGSAAQATTSSTRAALDIDGGYCGGGCPTQVLGTIVRGNTFDSNRQTHIFVQHGSNTLIENNTFINAKCAFGEDATNTLGIKVSDAANGASTGIIIRNNILRDWESRAACGQTMQGYGTLAGIWCDVGPVNGEVSGNLIYNINQGDPGQATYASQAVFIEFGCTGWVIKNNVIHDIGVTAFRQRGYNPGSLPATWVGVANQWISNTVYRTGINGIQIATGKAIIKNNIFDHAGTAQLHFDTANAGVHTINYNLYFDNAGGTKVGQWGGATLNFAAWKAACGCDPNARNADPLFVNTTVGQEDLHVQPTSQACGGGETGVDMGAYACQAVVTPPLNPPTNVRVTSP